MSARFLTQCGPHARQLGPLNLEGFLSGRQRIRILQPPHLSIAWHELPAEYFARNNIRPASMADFIRGWLDGMIEGEWCPPVACLGSTWTHPITGQQRIPYLFTLHNPANLQDWRLRTIDRPYNLHWRFAVWQLPLDHRTINAR